ETGGPGPLAARHRIVCYALRGSSRSKPSPKNSRPDCGRRRDTGRRGMRILLADDNHFYRVALEATLREWGYEVISVGDGTAALDVLESDDAPKMAVLDWVMPGL